MIGASPLLISVLLKCTPRHWVEKLGGGPIDETKVAADSGLTAAFNKVASVQVGGGEAQDDGFKAADSTKDTNA